MKMLLKGGVLILAGFGLLLGLIVYKNMRLGDGASALKSEQYETAMHKLKPLAIVGDSDAQYWVGLMYAYGWGVPKDDGEALRWFRRAGLWSKTETDRAAPAAFHVGKSYEEGRGGVPKSEMEAVKWYRIAAEGGYRSAAQTLGKAYAEGSLGLPRDSKQSAYWFNKGR